MYLKIRALVHTVDSESQLPGYLRWRITSPFKHIRDYRWDAQTMWVPIGTTLDSDIDILIVPRVIPTDDAKPRVEEWYKQIRSNGTKIVYEADDDIWSESYVGCLSKVGWSPDRGRDLLIALIDELQNRTKQALWMLKQCDAVTVSTKPLASYVQTITDAPVYVVPNALDYNLFKQGLKDNQSWGDTNQITIGWAGGRRNESDLTDMVEGWARYAVEDSSVLFVVSGWVPEIIKNEPRLDGRYISIPFAPMESYANVMQVDIGCVSVSNEPFSLRKSPIKSWEYALAGAMVLGSKNLYEQEPLIVTCERPSDWVRALRYYVKYKETRTKLAEAFQMHVRQFHLLETEYYNWIETYANIKMGV